MKNRITAGVLAVQIILSELLLCIPAYAAQNIVNISTKEEFTEFAKSCDLDSRSAGMTVNLTADIDFTGSEFVPIATFGGTFNGNGFTVSGVNFSQKGSYRGVFRYIQPGGKVSDLNIKAKIIPGGSKSFIGGVTGENSGTIENCSFNGSVKGENGIGGICGNNTDSGKILYCTAEGSIAGENSTGGIAGRNSGFISGCTNYAAVNTVYEEKKSSITDLETDRGALLENYKNKEEENESESVFGHSDTGGICGYSSGIIQGCTNNAEIGYNHVGYNVGGIVGRQSGYMLGCDNHGMVKGRKDVGGITGQAEPYILLNTSESGLKNLRAEMNRLHSDTEKFTADADNLSDLTKSRLEGISAYARSAGESAEDMLNQGTDFADDNLAEINAWTAIISDTLDKTETVFDVLERGGANISDALTILSDTIENLSDTAPDLSDETTEIKDAVERMKKAEKSIDRAQSRFERAEDALDEAIKIEDKNNVKKALSNISSALKDIIAAKKEIRTALQDIEKILASKPDSFEELGINAKKIAEDLKIIGENTENTRYSLQRINNAVETVITNTEFDFEQFKIAAENIYYSFGYMAEATEYIVDGLKDIGTELEGIYDKLSDYGGELDSAADNLAQSLDLLSLGAEDIKDACGDLKDIFGDLAEEKPLEFVKLGDGFKQTSEDLFDSLAGISDELESLRSDISNSGISEDIKAISNRFNSVMNLLVGEFEELTEGGRTLSDIIVDVSDEDIQNTKQGKIERCRNYAEVRADRNSGGIAGAVAIEYEKDPEDDIKKPDTLNFTYRTKAVIQSCVNDGAVIVKKDCAGGISGLSEIGTVYKCENYAEIKSENGNYAGGITGKNTASIRKCYARGRIEAKRYAGGIAGKASVITSSYSIVTASADENAGAICGDAEKDSSIFGNYYVNNGLGAIDGISYTKKAEPIEFNALSEISAIPDRFVGFSVTFTADGKTVETQNIRYGEPSTQIRYPEIPEKDGYFGTWAKPDAEFITEDTEIVCEYKPYITILSSNERDGNGKLALMLAEGKFTDKAELRVKQSVENPPVRQTDGVKVYEVVLNNTDIKDNDSVTLRILNKNKDKVTAWRMADGKWQKIKTAKKGKYAVLQTSGARSVICVKYEKTANAVWVFVPAMLLVLAGAAFKFGKFKNRKEKNTVQM